MVTFYWMKWKLVTLSLRALNFCNQKTQHNNIDIFIIVIFSFMPVILLSYSRQKGGVRHVILHKGCILCASVLVVSAAFLGFVLHSTMNCVCKVFWASFTTFPLLLNHDSLKPSKPGNLVALVPRYLYLSSVCSIRVIIVALASN